MRILFGPEHDGLHIDPDDPGAYEWWYFDAISDDERYVLVVIFFIGTPMSPYYKAVVDGKRPLPKDWCGVFVSIHERIPPSGYRELAYTYNLYRLGNDPQKDSGLTLGQSSFATGGDRDRSNEWRIALNERGLWLGELHGDLNFSSANALSTLSLGEESAHTWVCVAPQCRVTGTIKLPSRESIAFSGNGYHDHNFGLLPWGDISVWFWARARLTGNSNHTYCGDLVTYAWQQPEGTPEAFALLLDTDGNVEYAKTMRGVQISAYLDGSYGFRSPSQILWQDADANGLNGTVKMAEPNRGSIINDGPFYRRFLVDACVTNSLPGESAIRQGRGIGEAFCPAKLCGPIASRAMWTRMRRRS